MCIRDSPYAIGQIRIDRTDIDFPDVHSGEKPVITLEMCIRDRGNGLCEIGLRKELRQGNWRGSLFFIS